MLGLKAALRHGLKMHDCIEKGSLTVPELDRRHRIAHMHALLVRYVTAAERMVEPTEEDTMRRIHEVRLDRTAAFEVVRVELLDTLRGDDERGFDL